MNEDASQWAFWNEGGGHVIFRNVKKEKVEIVDVAGRKRKIVRPMIRMSKVGFKETNEKDALKYTSLREASAPLFCVKVSRDFVLKLNCILLESESRRESKRRKDRLNIEIRHVVLTSDRTRLEKVSTWCVEIKPKCGVLPSSPYVTRWIKRKKSRFWLHQRFKLHCGKIKRISEYEPLNLFKGNVNDISESFRNLIRTPQNNLRVFRDGKQIDVSKVDSKVFNVAAKVLKSSRIIEKLRQELEMRNPFDIEMVVRMYAFCCRFKLKSLSDDDEIWTQRTDIYNRTGDLHINITLREAFEVIRNYLIWKTLCDVSILCTFSKDGLKEQVTIIDTGLKSHEKIPYYYTMDEEITRFNQSRELHLANAHEVIHMLRAKEITSKCLVDIVKQRHALQDLKVHSTPTTCFDRAYKFIRTSTNIENTILRGCPVLIKDLNEVQDVRTTFGSVLYADYVSKKSDPIVCLLESNGAVVCGKTNSPEFGAGSQTFNRLFPSTRSPRDIRTTSGGSSGGTASALGTHQCWLASGSDLGGSLRIPAAFCGVVGFRVSPGLVPRDDEDTRSGPRHNLHAVNGPMGRVVRDVAIFLDAMTTKTRRTPGWDFDSPCYPFEMKNSKIPSILVSEDVSEPESQGKDSSASKNYFETISIRAAKKAILLSTRRHDKARKSRTKFVVGFSTLNCPCDAKIVHCCLEAAKLFVKYLKYESEMATLQRHVRFDDETAWRIFSVLRAEKFRTRFEKLVKSSDRYDFKPEVVWNAEQGMDKNSDVVTKALKDSERFRAEIERLFRGDIDLLLVPATPCLSFDVNVRYPNSICGKYCDTYLDWMRLACVISSTFLCLLYNVFGIFQVRNTRISPIIRTTRNTTHSSTNLKRASTGTGCPAIVIPCGSSSDGRTIGIQIVAPPGRDDIAIAAASFLEATLHRELASVRAIRAAASQPTVGTCDLSDVDGPRTSQDAAKHHNLKDWKSWLEESG